MLVRIIIGFISVFIFLPIFFSFLIFIFRIIEDAIEKVGIRPLESILIRNGGWPMIMEPGEWDSEIFSWKKVHDFYSHLSEISALYEISVTKDRRGIDSLDIDEDNDEDEMKMAISVIIIFLLNWEIQLYFCVEFWLIFDIYWLM